MIATERGRFYLGGKVTGFELPKRWGGGGGGGALHVSRLAQPAPAFQSKSMGLHHFNCQSPSPSKLPCCSVFPCHTPEQVRSELPANTDVVAFQVGRMGRVGWGGEQGGRRASSLRVRKAIVVQRQGLHVVGPPSNPILALSACLTPA